LPDPGHLSALCIGMLALGFFLISNLRIFRIPAMACSKVDEFLEARPFSFALPNESDFPRDAKVRDRAKSDGIDAELLLQTLLAWLRGEPPVCSMVPIPIEADEDARRRVRERAELVAERIGLVDRIGAVLATLGAGDGTAPAGLTVSNLTQALPHAWTAQQQIRPQLRQTST
jgi:hypothetical protein